jgi:hypothetical protein
VGLACEDSGDSGLDPTVLQFLLLADGTTARALGPKVIPQGHCLAKGLIPKASSVHDLCFADHFL